MIENGKMKEKWVNRKYFSFSHLCLIRRVEKLRDEKLFCLVKKKNERIENRVYINLPSCHITKGNILYFFFKLCIDGHFIKINNKKNKK